ncbi:UPF0415 protein C7orf25-like protein [Trichoplax sp. H2]|nr:UPF0415 protein C7orf25-like protein [Trichoplax sp. H2]|eukprot:RDD44031.1 UPF0415 protein C7orf25-like protein [Trichoplax sp. H2]
METKEEMNMDQMKSKAVDRADNLLCRAKEFRHVQGANKLIKKILAELNFLQSTQIEDLQKKTNNLKSNNLNYFSAMVNTISSCHNLVGIFKSFSYLSSQPNQSRKILMVDVVCDNGLTWIKVISRNPLALHRLFQGEGRYGEKHIMHQANEYLMAHEQHPCNFSKPSLVFSFSNGLSEAIADELKAAEIKVIGQIIPNDYFDHDGLSDYKELPLLNDIKCDIPAPNMPACTKAFFDITTLFAYVAEVTNGDCHREFKDPILQAQAIDEKECPVLPQINEYIEGKELYTCKAAVEDFRSILMTVGSIRERERSKDLLEKLTVVDDDPSARVLQLKTSSKVKLRSIIVFGTSDKLKATIITANVAFLRSAANQGVEFSAFVHQSRFLTGIRQSLPDEEYANLIHSK